MKPFRVTVVKMTDAAMLVRTSDGTEAWLPLSQIEYDENAETGDEIDIVVPNWLADQKGLDDE